MGFWSFLSSFSFFVRSATFSHSLSRLAMTGGLEGAIGLSQMIVRFLSACHVLLDLWHLVTFQPNPASSIKFCQCRLQRAGVDYGLCFCVHLCLRYENESHKAAAIIIFWPFDQKTSLMSKKKPVLYLYHCYRHVHLAFAAARRPPVAAE